MTGEPATTPPADATIASTAYQQILAAFSAPRPTACAPKTYAWRGLGTAAKDVEGMRAKLKRLLARQILTETEPGLFSLAPQQPSA